MQGPVYGIGTRRFPHRAGLQGQERGAGPRGLEHGAHGRVQETGVRGLVQVSGARGWTLETGTLDLSPEAGGLGVKAGRWPGLLTWVRAGRRGRQASEPQESWAAGPRNDIGSPDNHPFFFGYLGFP